MCYAASCTPTCGKCRPKRIVEVSCPECGAMDSRTREEYLILFDLPHRKSVLDRKIIERGGVDEPMCKMCHYPLMETYKHAVKAEPCHLQGVLCGFPCGRKDECGEDATPPCRTMVPLGKCEAGNEE